MSTLFDIKPARVTAKVNGQARELRYDFNALAFVAERAGSISRAFELLNNGMFLAKSLFLEAGLLWSNKNTKLKQPHKKETVERATPSIQTALDQALPQDYNFIEEWDWSLIYYTATVVLNMSEGSFWKCTPKKLLALLRIHREIQQKQPEEILQQHNAVETFMKW